MRSPRFVAIVGLGTIGLLGAGCASDAATRADVVKPNPILSVASTTSAELATTSTSVDNGSATTQPAVRITSTPTVPPSTAAQLTPTLPAAPGTCLADDTKLAKALMTYARSQQPTIPMTIKDIRHARSDATWARASVVPASADNIDAFVAIAHCIGEQWKVEDMGTSGVGCSSNVPRQVRKEIGLECQ